VHFIRSDVAGREPGRNDGAGWTITTQGSRVAIWQSARGASSASRALPAPKGRSRKSWPCSWIHWARPCLHSWTHRFRKRSDCSADAATCSRPGRVRARAQNLAAPFLKFLRRRRRPTVPGTLRAHCLSPPIYIEPKVAHRNLGSTATGAGRSTGVGISADAGGPLAPDSPPVSGWPPVSVAGRSRRRD